MVIIIIICYHCRNRSWGKDGLGFDVTARTGYQKLVQNWIAFV